jgi:ABC-type uncharacterized transport system substrate-binding protein
MNVDVIVAQGPRVVNPRAAKALGLTLPQSLVARADQVLQ